MSALPSKADIGRGEECPLGAPCDQRGFFGPNVTRHRVNEVA